MLPPLYDSWISYYLSRVPGSALPRATTVSCARCRPRARVPRRSSIPNEVLYLSPALFPTAWSVVSWKTWTPARPPAGLPW